MLGRRGRRAIVVLTTGVVILGLVLFGAALNGRPPGDTDPLVDSPVATGSTGSTGSISFAPGPIPSPVAGPTVFYDVLGQGRLTLYQRTLDGQAEPVELARRPAEEEGTARFIVGPADGSVLFAARVAGTIWKMEPVATEAPLAAAAWSLEVPEVDFRNGVWSPDGRYWASFGSTEIASYALVVDAALGRSWRLPLRPGQYVQGFDGLGPILIVREAERDALGWATGTRFEAIDPIDGRSQPISVEAADAPPHSDFGMDVAPRAGLWVGPSQGLGQLVVGNLATGERRTIDRVETSFVYAGFLPAADRVLAFVAGTDDLGETQLTLRIVDVSGGARQLWRGLSWPMAVAFAPEGDIVGFDSWGDTGSMIVIVDTISERLVELPLPERARVGALLAIRGGVPVPALPAAPTPTPASATPMPSPIAGAPRLVTGSIDYDAIARSATVRVQLVGPAEGGGLAVIDEMPPVVLSRVRRIEPWVQISPRPGASSVVVAIGDDDSSSLTVWTPSKGGVSGSPAPGAELEVLPLPDDAPDRVTGIIWRPDGKAIAMRDWEAPGDVLWFELDDLELRRVPVPELWADIVGWSADGEVLVVRHGVCTEGCPPPYSLLGALRLRDGQFSPVTPKSPVDALVVGAPLLDGVSVRTGLVASGVGEGTRLEFTPGIGIGESFSLAWPRGFGRLDTGFLSAAWSADGRNLYLAVDTERGRELLRIDDPRAGVPLRPVAVGLLPPGTYPLEVDPTDGWARVVSRFVDGCREGLVDLRTGRSYLADCAGASVWFPAP
ncbi:MAG: hypothetical protein C0498_08030 [Anaerolinea sp.]|nr:hypothetical protein [Anaerolinea sp.]